ncbi:MAG: hypothetical protein U1U88_001530 [Lawsonella clevelandensis]
MEQPWQDCHAPPERSRRANRHGTVIRITDPTAKQKLYTLWTGKPAPPALVGCWNGLNP